MEFARVFFEFMFFLSICPIFFASKRALQRQIEASPTTTDEPSSTAPAASECTKMTRITAPDDGDEDGDGDSPPLPATLPFHLSPSASASSRTPSQRALPDIRSSSPALLSVSSTRAPPQWVPLDKHLFFSSADGGVGTREPLNDYPRSSNLLSWDANSSRLYVWDPLSQTVLRLSLRFRDPEPPSSLSAVLEAAIPFEVTTFGYRPTNFVFFL